MSPGDAGNGGTEEFQRSLNEMTRILPEGINAPEVHLVAQRSELVERIFLLEEDLNERIIEYIKYIIYTKNLDRLDPTRKNLLFDTQDSNDETLYFVIQDMETHKLEGTLQFQREAYESLDQMFDRDDKTANLFELFPGPYVSARALLSQDVGPEESSTCAWR